MNSEHFNKTEYIGNKYGLILNNDGKYEVLFHNIPIIASNKNNLVNQIMKLEESINLINCNSDLLIDMYKKNNRIWFNLETQDGNKFTVSSGGYKRILKSRKKFEEQVKDNGHLLLSSYYSAKEKVLIDYQCGHDASMITPNEYLSGHRCALCSGNIVKPYVNDVYTKHSELVKFFINPKDAIGASINKNKSLFQCPNCGYQKYNSTNNIYWYGFSCPICSDGISFPEKFMICLLEYLNEKYEYQPSFNWCKFEIDNIEHYGRYDFLLLDKKIIIEMDGSQHYEISHFLINKIDLELNQTKDKIKSELAIKNGYKIIRINCNYGNKYNRFEYIKQNVINSLSDILNLNKIDWNIILDKTSNSLMSECWNLWNNGYSIKNICDNLKLSNTTIIKYLKIGNDYNKCNYSKTISHSRSWQKSEVFYV